MAVARNPDLVRRLGKVYTAVLSDELDKMGFRSQVLRPDIRPLFPEADIAGVAFTVHAVPVFDPPEQDPYKLEFEAVDALQADDVLCCSRVEGSFWGELLSTAAQLRGCRGVIADAYARDTRRIIELGFATFARGIHVADSLGRLEVKSYGEPIVCGDVRIEPGDLVRADYDGVVVVPQAVAEEAIRRAEEKAGGEDLVRKHLADGMTVTEAYRRFGVM